MPLAGREILPRDAYGYIYKALQDAGVAALYPVSRQLLATAMFESGGYSKIRDNARKVLRDKGTPEAELPPRYWVMYAKATYANTDGSIDRGLFMINSLHHSTVTDEQAFDPQFAAEYAVKLYKQAGMTPWYGWRDVMSPAAIEKMKTDPAYPYRSHLDGAQMRWQRTFMAEANYFLTDMDMPRISVAELA